MTPKELRETLIESRDLLNRQIETLDRVIESEGQADIEDDKAGGLKLMVIDTLKGRTRTDPVSDQEMADRQQAYFEGLGVRAPRH